MSMKANEMLVGKVVEDVQYLAHTSVVFTFTDGTILRVDQVSQSGALNVNILPHDSTVVSILDPDDLNEVMFKEEV